MGGLTHSGVVGPNALVFVSAIVGCSEAVWWFSTVLFLSLVPVINGVCVLVSPCVSFIALCCFFFVFLFLQIGAFLALLLCRRFARPFIERRVCFILFQPISFCPSVLFAGVIVSCCNFLTNTSFDGCCHACVQLKDNKQVALFDEAVAMNAYKFTILLRVTPIPFPWQTAFLSATRVRTSPLFCVYFLVSLFCFVFFLSAHTYPGPAPVLDRVRK